jgi:hypothetical protein
VKAWPGVDEDEAHGGGVWLGAARTGGSTGMRDPLAESPRRSANAAGAGEAEREPYSSATSGGACAGGVYSPSGRGSGCPGAPGPVSSSDCGRTSWSKPGPRVGTNAGSTGAQSSARRASEARGGVREAEVCVPMGRVESSDGDGARETSVVEGRSAGKCRGESVADEELAMGRLRG